MADIPEVFYNGNNITCYPSSNAEDDGKLNLEFNMARLVTRLSSKNFCITNPAFQLTVKTDELSGSKTIEVGVGQASINGMDLIMNDTITIDPPSTINTRYYLAFKLHRDSSNNVEGDFTHGVDLIFKGLSLTYFTDKGEDDKDRLNLGTVIWDGSDFTELLEDEDKYGRIWAEDILCKLLDPKHPDNRRMLLQDWLYNVPDWYFSKEGDTIYGPLQIMDSRDSNNPGILMNVTEDNSTIIIKNPDEDNTLLQFYGDLDRSGSITQDDIDLVQAYIDGTGTLTDLQLILADVNGDGVVDEKDLQYITDYVNQVEGVSYGKTGQIYFIDNTTHGITFNTIEDETSFKLANGEIKSTDENNWVTEFNSTTDLDLHSNRVVNIQGDNGVNIGAGGNGDAPTLTIGNHKATLTDNRSNDLKYEVNFVSGGTTIQQTLGKAIWQYSNQVVSLLSTDVTTLDIAPNGIFDQNLRVVDTLSVGTANANSQTTITDDQWTITDGSNTSTFTPSTIGISTAAGTTGQITLAKANNNSKSILDDTGKLQLINTTTGTPNILFSQNVSASDVTLSKVNNSNTLNLAGNLTVSQNITATNEITGSGLTTANGTLTFVNGTNNATINKGNGSSLLYTSNALNVGQTGNQALKAGVTTLSGNLTVGSASNGVVITTAGDITATNTITGNKVIGAIYQDVSEAYKKDKEEIIEDGDIVYINEKGLVSKPKTMEDCKKIIGICSEKPFMILGDSLYEEDEKCLVGILGKLYAKTNQDFLTYGDKVKATPNGVEKVRDLISDLPYIVGTVVEPYKDGKVRINFNKVI